MELVNYNDKVLSTPPEMINFDDPPFNLIEFAQELVKFMHSKNGIGLSANQIGIPYQIFAMRGHPENFVCINPRVIDTSSELVLLEEGCLSYPPQLLIKVKRPKDIKVRFQTPNGETLTKKFTGMTARVFQHEMMHMQGDTFWSGCNRYHFEKGIKKAKLNNINYGVGL